jgi:predicted RNA-binding protein with TRAM domain
VIFVKGGQVGQNTKVKVTQVGGRFATAEVIGEGSPQPAESATE